MSCGLFLNPAAASHTRLDGPHRTNGRRLSHGDTPISITSPGPMCGPSTEISLGAHVHPSAVLSLPCQVRGAPLA